MINKYCRGAVIQITKMFRPHYPSSLPKGPLKNDFLDIFLTIFYGAGISLNTSAMRVIFCWKMFKI